MRRKLLLTLDPGEGGNPSPAPAGDPPPIAEKVLNNPGVKETDAGEIVRLNQQLESERNARKKVETRVAELEDENRVLKTPPEKKPAPEKKAFLSGANLGGFF